MSEGLAERGVAVGSGVAGAVERLIGGAVGRPAEDALAVRRRELGVDVDRCKASHRTLQMSALRLRTTGAVRSK